MKASVDSVVPLISLHSIPSEAGHYPPSIFHAVLNSNSIKTETPPLRSQSGVGTRERDNEHFYFGPSKLTTDNATGNGHGAGRLCSRETSEEAGYNWCLRRRQATLFFMPMSLVFVAADWLTDVCIMYIYSWFHPQTQLLLRRWKNLFVLMLSTLYTFHKYYINTYMVINHTKKQALGNGWLIG